jgi:hypothetical protein
MVDDGSACKEDEKATGKSHKFANVMSMGSPGMKLVDIPSKPRLSLASSRS